MSVALREKWVKRLGIGHVLVARGWMLLCTAGKGKPGRFVCRGTVWIRAPIALHNRFHPSFTRLCPGTAHAAESTAPATDNP